MISDSSFHGADVRFRALITKSDTLSYEGLAFLYRLFTQRGPSHNQNPIFTTETRRHGDTEKSRGKTKSKANTESKPENSREPRELLKKLPNAAGPQPKSNIHHGDAKARSHGEK